MHMSDKNETQPSQADAELEREIRKERKFSLAEAIGRLAGPGAMKGASPIARKEQAGIEIETWLRRHLIDPDGALQVALLRSVKGSELLLNNFDQPLVVLAACCQKILGCDDLLKELVRNADIEWGRIFGQRPYFEQQGVKPDPDDPYTIESVRNTLCRLLTQLEAGEG
jgi:hypothetical protein